MTSSPIRDRVRNRKRQQFLARANLLLAAVNFLVLVTVLVVFL